MDCNQHTPLVGMLLMAGSPGCGEHVEQTQRVPLVWDGTQTHQLQKDISVTIMEGRHWAEYCMIVRSDY